MNTRRYTSWEDQPEILPELDGYRFYRDSKKGDTGVIVDDDGRVFHLINIDYPRGRYANEQLTGLWFGEMDPKLILSWQPKGSLEAALEDDAGWLADHAPGLIISDKEMKEYYDDARKELSADAEFSELDEEEQEEKIREQAETDLTYTESGFIQSWAWGDIQLDAGLVRAAMWLSYHLYEEINGADDPPHGGLSDNEKLVDQFIDMAAESHDIDPKDAFITTELEEDLKDYDTELWAALQQAAILFPPKGGAPAISLWDAEGPYLVFMTLQGHGVGIWDGSWDKFYSKAEIERVQAFLESKLSHFADRSGGGSLLEALANAARGEE